MWNLIHISLRLIVAACGVVLLYLAWFQYEDGEGNVQNTLERWWMSLSDSQNSAISKQTAFMREAAKGTGQSLIAFSGRSCSRSEPLAFRRVIHSLPLGYFIFSL